MGNMARVGGAYFGEEEVEGPVKGDLDHRGDGAAFLVRLDLPPDAWR